MPGLGLDGFPSTHTEAIELQDVLVIGASLNGDSTGEPRGHVPKIFSWPLNCPPQFSREA